MYVELLLFLADAAHLPVELEGFPTLDAVVSDDAEADLSRHHLDIGDLFGEVLDRCALWPNGRRQALPRLEDRGTGPPVQA